MTSFRNRRYCTRRVRRGFSLVSAIFLLIVLSALGVAMVNISTTQHASSALDVQVARAYQAARAGIEWGLFQQLRAGAACSGTPNSFTPPAPTLSAFTVTVICDPPVPLAPVPVRRIRSNACNQPVNGNCPGNGGAAYYVEREVQVKL